MSECPYGPLMDPLWTCMDLYGPVWTCMDLYGPVWTCMDRLYPGLGSPNGGHPESAPPAFTGMPPEPSGT